MGGAELKPWKSGTAQAAEKESVYQNEQKVTVFNERTSETSTRCRSNDEYVSEQKNPTLAEQMNKEETQPKEQRKEIPLENEEMHELPNHEYCNRSNFPESGSKGVIGAAPLPKSQPEEQTPEESSPKLLSIAQSKAPASAQSVAEAKDRDENVYQNARYSGENSTEPMGEERDLHKEQGKGTLLRDKEMFELSGPVYCNRLELLKSGFKGVNGAVLAPVSQPEKHTPEKSEKETPNSKSEAESTGDGNKANASVLSSPSPKPIETHSKADRPEHHLTKRHTSPRSDTGVALVGKDNSDNSIEGKSSPKSEIVSGIRASRECSVSLEENKNNAGRSQPDTYENQNLSTPVSVVHSEVLASCVLHDEREHEEEEEEGEHNTSIDPKFASQHQLSDVSSSRSRHRKSPWRKFSGLFKKEPMPTFDVIDPAEEQRQQENRLLNDPTDVKGEGEVRTRPPADSGTFKFFHRSDFCLSEQFCSDFTSPMRQNGGVSKGTL
ncbi:unnamed protein product [Taenia asiatica]|uniref:Coronin n=1 Tax=Taenia asiatica TaxID=60517 RepID=A0A158R8Y2_TAEAS|nr:unnamed protein product [Taenia asiatica]